MTGLEKITEKIIEQSKLACDEIFLQTNIKIKEMIAEARFEASQRAEKIVSSAKKKAERRNATAKGMAESITRNRYLEIRNAILNDIISAAYEEIEKFSDEEYFDMLFKLLVKNVQKGECTMYLGGYDLGRLPENFQDKINEAVYEKGAVLISKKAIDIENGFILDYGDIQVNCTLKAVFDEEMDSLKDMLSSELFKV